MVSYSDTQGRRAASVSGRHLRFAGSLGGTNIEVRGSNAVEVAVDRDAGEILITIGDVTVHLTRTR